MAAQTRNQNFIARASAMVVIVGLGLGLTATYNSLLDERKAGVEQTRLLLTLKDDNAKLAADNAKLREILNEQGVLIRKLAKVAPLGTINIRQLEMATNIPPRPVLSNENAAPSSPPAPPKSNVDPKPTPAPETHILCVPLLSVCL